MSSLANTKSLSPEVVTSMVPVPGGHLVYTRTLDYSPSPPQPTHDVMCYFEGVSLDGYVPTTPAFAKKRGRPVPDASSTPNISLDQEKEEENLINESKRHKNLNDRITRLEQKLSSMDDKINAVLKLLTK